MGFEDGGDSDEFGMAGALHQIISRLIQNRSFAVVLGMMWLQLKDTVRTFKDLFVSFMPRPMISLSQTKTHPTGVSSD